MANVFGNFYFKLNGLNLDGEYLNNVNGVTAQETGLRTSGGKHPFEGVYKSRWKDGKQSIAADLTIKWKPNGIYDLEWRNITRYNKSEFYRGQGFLRHGELMGYYQLIP